MYDQGGEFLDYEFKHILIGKSYGIKNKPDYPGDPQKNKNIEIMHQVIWNIVQTYNLHCNIFR